MLKILRISHDLWLNDLYLPQPLVREYKTHVLDKNRIMPQTLGDSFYHMLTTLYKLFIYFIIWTIKSGNFTTWHFVNKLRKIDICL
jgi:hypothetical protein